MFRTTAKYLILIPLFIVSCNSSQEESAPSEVPLTGESLETRAELSTLLHTKMTEVEQGITLVDYVKDFYSVAQFQKENPKNVFLKILKNFHPQVTDQIPAFDKNEGVFEFSVVPELSQKIKNSCDGTDMDLKFSFSDKEKKTLEKMEYGLTFCDEEKKLHRILTVTFEENVMKIEFHQTPDTVEINEKLGFREGSAECQYLKLNESEEIEMRCTGVVVAPSPQETALIKSVVYSPQAENHLKVFSKALDADGGNTEVNFEYDEKAGMKPLNEDQKTAAP